MWLWPELWENAFHQLWKVYKPLYLILMEFWPANGVTDWSFRCG